MIWVSLGSGIVKARRAVWGDIAGVGWSLCGGGLSDISMSPHPIGTGVCKRSPFLTPAIESLFFRSMRGFMHTDTQNPRYLLEGAGCRVAQCIYALSNA